MKMTTFFSLFSQHPASVNAVDFLSKITDWWSGQFSRHLAAVSAVVFYCWLKSYNFAVLPWKSILFSANFLSSQLPWVLSIFWLKLLTSQVGQFSRHFTAVSIVVFFADKSLITVLYCREKGQFSQIVLMAQSCRECSGFFTKIID